MKARYFMEKTPIFRGVGTAMITPFKKDGKIDFESLKKLTEMQLCAGTDALIVCGTTGECATLTREERFEITRSVTAEAGDDCKVICGTGCNDTQKAITYTKDAVQAGADGILAVTPYYNKTNQKGLIKYYKTICESTTKPVIAYNVPSRTGVNIMPETAFEISKLPNAAGLKEASGNMAQITETAALCGEALPIYSGSDEINISVFAIGGIGMISVVSNAVPEKMKELWNRWQSGDTKGAAKLQGELFPLIKSMFSDINPIPVKRYLYEKGLTEFVLRPPLYAE